MMMGSVAAALAEAWETGHPVALLADAKALATLAEAEDVAGALLQKLAITPCGIRMAENGLLGAMLPGRIVAHGSPLPLAVLPHGIAAPALLVVLGEAITEAGTSLPSVARLHPALDVATSRWRDGPADMFQAAADLAGLGHVVMGKGRPPAWPVSCALAFGEERARARPVAAAALFAQAVQAAREAGGLPQGAVLVLVFDSRAVPVTGACEVTARWTGLGLAQVTLRG